MSERVTFEAWAVQRDAGRLIAYDSPGVGPLLLGEEDTAERQSMIDTAFGVGSSPVRVRVTVEIIEPGGEDGA